MGDSDAEQLPDEIKEEARSVELNLLPEKSRKVYQQAYRNFLVFCEKQKVKLYSEEVLLVDFAELSKKMKSSTSTNAQEQKSMDFTECNTVTIHIYNK
jgi:hypothetical protein